ncbi:hypothetical protein ACFL2V_13185 [Pseudomonadota bacterium]
MSMLMTIAAIYIVCMVFVTYVFCGAAREFGATAALESNRAERTEA